MSFPSPSLADEVKELNYRQRTQGDQPDRIDEQRRRVALAYFAAKEATLDDRERDRIAQHWRDTIRPLFGGEDIDNPWHALCRAMRDEGLLTRVDGAYTVVRP